MFFSKKEEKTGWEIKEQFLLNYKIDGSIESYKLSSLYACFNRVEGRVSGREHECSLFRHRNANTRF